MSKRAVFVLGTGRSGTSAVALMLQALGVYIGDEFTDADRNNQYGTGEDLGWRLANSEVLKGTWPAVVFGPLIADRSKIDVWGVKDPAFARTLTEAIGTLATVEPDREPLVIVCRRGKAVTINSFMRAYQSGRIAANEWYDTASLNVAARLGEFRGRVLEVWFDDLLREPGTWARRISTFVDATAGRENEAAAVIQSRLPQSERGFGNIAIGVRIASHPAVPFFVSWTTLLTGGVRSGDKVLMPRAHGPAHHSGTKIARDFLQSNCDTLLMVDDDMVFSGNQLERMRESEANQEFDIVMAFATHRAHPPKPVMLHWQGPADVSTGQYSYVLPTEKCGTVEVDAAGLAFTLIRRHVLEAKLGDLPLKMFFPFAYGAGWESDDIPFSAWCRENGYRMGIDTENDIGHCGCHSYGWDDYVKWQADLAEVDRAKLEHRLPDEGAVDLEWDTLGPIIEAVAGGDALEPYRQAAQDILGIVRGGKDE